MFKHFHLTKLQWKGILKWALYSFCLLLVLLVQTVISAKAPWFGIKPSLVPIYLVCVAIREGPEKGGFFALGGTVFWCLSGVDYGNLSVGVVTVCAVLSAVACRAVLTQGLISTALCCFVTLLLNETIIFVFKLILTPIAPGNFWRILLPGAVLSMLFCPISYVLVRAVSRTGGNHGL